MFRPLAVCIAVFAAACAQDSGTDLQSPTVPSASPSGSPASGSAFTLGGWVGDGAGRLIAGATVTVIAGSEAGAVAVTDSQGRYDFARSFSGPVQLRASKAGYVQETKSLTSASPGNRLDFRLGSPNGNRPFDGRYFLTLSADSTCTALPAEVRSRRYRGVASGPTFPLYGATFAEGFGSYGYGFLYLGIFENYVSIQINDPPIWELISPERYLAILGSAAGTFDADGGNLTLAGTFTYCPSRQQDSSPKCSVPEITCQSNHHTLALVRY